MSSPAFAVFQNSTQSWMQVTATLSASFNEKQPYIPLSRLPAIWLMEINLSATQLGDASCEGRYAALRDRLL